MVTLSPTRLPAVRGSMFSYQSHMQVGKYSASFARPSAMLPAEGARAEPHAATLRSHLAICGTIHVLGPLKIRHAAPGVDLLQIHCPGVLQTCDSVLHTQVRKLSYTLSPSA